MNKSGSLLRILFKPIKSRCDCKCWFGSPRIFLSTHILAFNQERSTPCICAPESGSTNLYSLMVDSIVFITKRSQAPIRGPFIGMDYGLRSAFTLNHWYQSVTVSSLGPEILVISTLLQTKPIVHLVSYHGSADFSPYLMNCHKSRMKLQVTSYLTNFLSLIFLFENPGRPRTLQK